MITLVEIEYEDEEEANTKTRIHLVNCADMRRGLGLMAQKYPYKFADIVSDNTDAATADLWMQCVLFGEEKYA